MSYKFIITMMACIFCSDALSAEYVRSNVTINTMLSIGAQRPSAPSSQDIIRLYLTAGSWGSSSCRTTSADIQKVDSHLISILLSAMAQNQPVSIAVDDTLRPVDDTCQVTFINVM